MNRWSYSTPTDQFGAKPYSRADADVAAPLYTVDGDGHF
jgi:hypothetical protein